MTGGFLCDAPDCNAFQIRPAATYEHRVTLVDDDGNADFHTITAHLCDDCALRVSGELALLPKANQIEEDETHDLAS